MGTMVQRAGGGASKDLSNLADVLIDTDVFIKDANGIVIGHTAQIDYGAVPEFQVVGDSNTDSSMGFGRFSNDNGGPDVRFLKSRGSTLGGNAIVQDGDKLGRFRFQADDGTDFKTTAAEIAAEVDGAPGVNDMPGRLLFRTTSDGASSVTERMRIDSKGNVGIGTTAPDEVLHVAGSVDGKFIGLLVENTQAASGGSTNETAEIRFGFGGKNDVARITADKLKDYTSGSEEESRIAFWVDVAGTPTMVAHFMPDGLMLMLGDSRIRFAGTAGGGGQSIQYKDSAGSNRAALLFPGSDIVALVNRTTNGVVEIRANTSTGGNPGEVTVATFEDSQVVFNEAGGDVDFRVEGSGNANMLVVDAGMDNMALGSTILGNAFLSLNPPSFTSDGSLDDARMVSIIGTLVGAATDTTFLVGSLFSTDITTQTATENIADIAQVKVDDPLIIDNLTGDITRASTILIAGIPTEGETNIGLMIDGGGSDDSYISLASSDLSTGLSTVLPGNDVVDDWFFSIEKQAAETGGVRINALAENVALSPVLQIDCWGGTATAVKTTAARTLAEITLREHDGANVTANIAANGNVFGIRAQVGGSLLMRFMVDEDGDLFAVNATIATFDDYDDAALLDTFDRTRAPASAIRKGWTGWTRYNEQTLIDCGILGGPICEGGMTNVTQLQRALVGAVRQAAEDLMSVVWALSPKQRAKLTARIQSRLQKRRVET